MGRGITALCWFLTLANLQGGMQEGAGFPVHHETDSRTMLPTARCRSIATNMNTRLTIRHMNKSGLGSTKVDGSQVSGKCWQTWIYRR